MNGSNQQVLTGPKQGVPTGPKQGAPTGNSYQCQFYLGEGPEKGLEGLLLANAITRDRR